MNPKLIASVRTSLLAAALLIVPAAALASQLPIGDRAADQLARRGEVPVKAAGPHVQVGTYQIQVSAKLGRPEIALADGAWLYPNFNVEGSDAAGTLVVRFHQGRVSALALVTPAVAQAMRPPQGARQQVIVAANQ